MNSLWHLIFPSLLIGLSAGICTVIHTAGASRLAPHTSRCSMNGNFTASHREDANCTPVLQSPQAVKKITCMSSSTNCLSGALNCGYFTLQPSITTPILWSLIVLLLTCENTCSLLFELLEGHNFSFSACTTHTNTQSVSQFVPQAKEEVIYPPLKVAKKNGRDQPRANYRGG